MRCKTRNLTPVGVLERVFPTMIRTLGSLEWATQTREIREEGALCQIRSPTVGVSWEIASKFFDQAIASIANPFAYVPITNGLIGLRAPRTPGTVPNTIIVFPDDDVWVLDEFGKLVLKHLPKETRKAGVFAVGAVHRLENFKQNQYPKALEHYWPSYRSDTTKTSFKPRSFAEGAHIARRYVMREPTASSAVELLASCLANLGELAYPNSSVQLRGRHKASIEEKLANQARGLCTVS